MPTIADTFGRSANNRAADSMSLLPTSTQAADSIALVLQGDRHPVREWGDEPLAE